MSPLIQNTMRTPTEISRIVMLTGIPIRKFFNLQWLPNSDDFLQTNAGMTAMANKRAARGAGSTSCTFLRLQSSQRLQAIIWYKKISKHKIVIFFWEEGSHVNFLQVRLTQVRSCSRSNHSSKLSFLRVSSQRLKIENFTETLYRSISGFILLIVKEVQAELKLGFLTLNTLHIVFC